MTQRTIILVFCVVVFLLPVAFGYQSDSSLLARSFDRTIALTNSQILVNVNFTNGATTAIRGFYFTDEIPSGLMVSTLSLMVNGAEVTNYLFESGQDGDDYPGYTPCRWVLEQPTNFAAVNPISPQSSAQIVYAITSSVSNIFNLQQFSWVGSDSTLTNAVFGYSESSDEQSVKFTTTAEQLVVSGQNAANGFQVELSGVPGSNYVIEASTNLSHWVPLVTNAAPFQFTDTNQAGFLYRFYRGSYF